MRMVLILISFTKIRRGPFTVRVIIAKEVYGHLYPYYLPESFFADVKRFLSKSYGESKPFLLFIKSHSSSKVEKQMPIKTLS